MTEITDRDTARSAATLEETTGDARVRRRDDGAVLRMSEAGASMVAGGGDDPANDVDEGQRMILNMGPSHPSTHGVLRLMLELEGETVLLSLIHI